MAKTETVTNVLAMTCEGVPTTDPELSFSECSFSSKASNTVSIVSRTSIQNSLIRYMVDSFVRSPAAVSSNFSDRLFCRICHESEQSFGQSPGSSNGTLPSPEPLISPCDCSGSVGLIHKSCLEKWLTTANNSHCEICGHAYQVTYKPKSWKQWILGTRFRATHKNLTTDILCFFILTPLAIISAYLCGSGAAYYLKSHDYSIEFVGLSSLASFLALMYVVWLILTIRFHVRSFRLWQKQNRDIRLAVVEELPENRV